MHSQTGPDDGYVETKEYLLRIGEQNITIN